MSVTIKSIKCFKSVQAKFKRNINNFANSLGTRLCLQRLPTRDHPTQRCFT